MKPATPLPWRVARMEGGRRACLVNKNGGNITYIDQEATRHADYIAHSANAYPRLVAALRHVVAFDQERGDFVENCERARALLRELGEL